MAGKRKITTVYVDEDLLELAKAKGINISMLLNEALKRLLGDEKKLKLEEIEQKIAELRTELAVLEAQRRALIEELEQERLRKAGEEQLSELLREWQELMKKKNNVRGTREEIEINQRLQKLRSRIEQITGLKFGTQEWVEFMSVLNKKGVGEAVEWLKKK